MARSRTTIGVLIGDGAPMLEVAVAPRVFSTAGAGFTVRTAGEHPGPLSTTAGIALTAPHTLDDLDTAGVVIVPGWRPPGGAPVAPAILDRLRRAHDEGATVVGLCLGAFVLAEAGLLDGRRATTHWHHLPAFAAAFPAVSVVDDVLYVDEGTVVTSAGSAAGLDACLHLLRREHGPRLANTAARALVVAPQRAGGQAQFIEHPVPQLPAGDAIGDAMRHALEHLEDPALDVPHLAAAVHLSRRTFDRRFRETTGVSPLRWLLQQRVLRAQHVLSTTDLDVDSVARACGFSDGVALRPHFRRLVGVPPQSYRASFRTP
ncbi:DJ-1/PfpI family protein [Dactylosporangium aurantiacum]|uniref:DJ-1/PfpI family protein n=1 Tax=Dactylosporangium aurantiacum TaxID=35754 RepID=A0A9Q9MJQ2_9ACTN|nr:helix-turn-helix domain-containing protein [Dactylosporangium aurantiacum]MDG6105523.1 helix-turn-helix domain-containing protein [Dactylosporangium aurantiacum]UWZ57130.1 DJ-1/PfpI family protein [Dactylosporangium aurantiacum]